MRLIHIIFFSFASIFASILFLAYQQEWIIIRSPWASSSPYSLLGVSKQNITLYYWDKNQEKKEDKELIISDEQEKKAAAIISIWLTLLHDEKIIKNSVTLQSALFAPDNRKLYISFDQPIFDKQQSTHSKWMLLQSLILTLQKNGISLTGIYLLINHQPMYDDQLDFSNMWVVKD